MILAIRISCCSSKTTIIQEMFFTMLGFVASVLHLCQKPVMAYTLKYFKIQTRCLQCGKEIMYGRADRKFCCQD